MHWVVVPVAQRADGGWVDEVLRERLRETPRPGLADPDVAVPRQRIEAVRDAAVDPAINALYGPRGWTDGLPVVAPTLGRVRDLLAHTALAPTHVLGDMEPQRGVATVERIAANAVMAGCAPEHFPVVLAAVTAVLDPAFNLRGVQTTDENVTPLVIVGGPVAARIGMNGGMGVLGPGWRANACIGRALRLAMTNIGGGWPAAVSMAGTGQPGRYTLCVAQNDSASPWPPLHVDLGLEPATSAVTVVRAESAINVTGDLVDLASVMATSASAFSILHGGKVAVLLAPHVVRGAAAQGMDRAAVRRWLHEHARLDTAAFERSWIARNIVRTYGLPEWVQRSLAGGRVPVVEHPEDIVLFVAGADIPIPQNAYFPAWGFPPAVITVPIADRGAT